MLKGKLEVDFTFSLYLIKIFSVLLDRFQRQRIRDAEVTAAQTFMSDCCNGNISFAAASLSSSAHISPRVQILIKNNFLLYTLHDEILYISSEIKLRIASKEIHISIPIVRHERLCCHHFCVSNSLSLKMV